MSHPRARAVLGGIAPALRGGAMTVGGIAFLFAAAAATAHAEDAAASTAAPAVRKVVIAPFGGKGGREARAIALELIAGRTDRSDFTVIGHDDAAVVAKRLGVSIDSADGRRAISEELGIDAWLDADLDADGEGELRLSGRDGRRVSSLALHGDHGRHGREQLREKLWPWIGPRISEQERIVQKLQDERARALEKVAAREQELGHQRQLVLEREQRRMKLLAGAHALAREKQLAREEEVARQVKIVRDREAAIALEQQRQQEEMARQQAELQRKQAEQERQLAEQQRQLALEEQRRQAAEQAALQAAAASKTAAPADAGGDAWQPPPSQWSPPPQPQPAAATWQPPPARWGQPEAQPTAAAQPAAAHPARSRWQPPAQPQPTASASRFQPAPAQGGEEPAPAAAGQPPMIEGISAETREWLLRKQRERAAAGGAGAYP